MFTARYELNPYILILYVRAPYRIINLYNQLYTYRNLHTPDDRISLTCFDTNGCHQQKVLPVQGQPSTHHSVHTYRITRTQPILGFLDDRQHLVKTVGAPKICAVDILVFYLKTLRRVQVYVCVFTH